MVGREFEPYTPLLLLQMGSLKEEGIFSQGIRITTKEVRITQGVYMCVEYCNSLVSFKNTKMNVKINF